MDESQLQIDLPHELITTEILPRLPLKSLIRFKSVSKQWKSLIFNPHFAKLHLQFHRNSNSHQYLFINNDDSSFLTLDYTQFDDNPQFTTPFSGFDPKIDDTPQTKQGLVELELGTDLLEQIQLSDDRFGVSIVGSCDGLVCLDFGLGSVFVWNPMTRESRKFPNPPSFRRKETVWGFGYVSRVDDYRIVSLSQKLHSYRKKVHTLSLKGGKWGKIDVPDGYNVDSLNDSGVLVDERVFWRMTNGYGALCIVGFDLGGESFREVEVPEWISALRDFFLCAIGGRLCVCWRDSDAGVEISMLKKYEDSGSWTRFCRIACDGFYCCNLFGFTRSGRILVKTLDGPVLLYDLDQECQTYMEILRLATCKDVVLYVESLVSPFGVVED